VDGVLVDAARYRALGEGDRVRMVTTGWPCRVLRID
jgi:hypothetical protein